MRRGSRPAGIILATVIILFCVSLCGAEDYYYAGGEKRALTRLPGLRSVPLTGSAPGAKYSRTRGFDIVEMWERHGVAIVRAAASARASASVTMTDEGNPVFDYGGGEPLVVTDEFIVRFPAGTTAEEIAALNKKHGAEIVRRIPNPPDTYMLRAAGQGELAALRLANAYYEIEGAVFAHPNFISRKAKKFTPDDPYFPRQWHLSNTGQGGAIPSHDVEAPAAWDITRGDRDVIIAVIDDGVDFSHEDMQGDKFVAGYDFFDDDGDPSAEPENDDFHGTAVMGVAAANGDNGVGVSGIAPGCRLMPIRLIAGPTSDDQDAAAIRWAADHGAWIISNSWGPPDGNPYFNGDEIDYPLPDIVRSAIDHAADDGREGKGCLVFWASGNGNEPVGYDGYASYGKALAVGACNDKGIRSFYSDYGPELDLCAPSDGGATSGIWTTDFSGEEGYNPGSSLYGDEGGNYTNSFGGTSSAAPLAAGAAALLLSREPSLTREEATDRLVETADRVNFDSGSYDINGHSIFYGYGRVNPASALSGRTRQPEVHITLSAGSAREGDTMRLSYSLRAGRASALNKGDAYVAVVNPLGRVLYMDSLNLFESAQVSIAPGFVVTDSSGELGSGFFLSGLQTGQFRLYGAVVTQGGDPLDPASWMHTPSLASFDYFP